MVRTKLMLAVLALMFVAGATTSQAATLRAFVSSTGSDTNAPANCQQTAPCRTFAGAFPTVTAGGELIALDTAGYGPIPSVNKAITIATVPGATAFVVVAGGTTGFPINAGASDLVILRNISFNGSGAANTTGVQHNGGRLLIQDCSFTQLTNGFGMAAALTTVADIINSVFTSNTKGVNVGGGQLNMDSCIVTKNTTGVSATGSGGESQVAQPAATKVRISKGMVSSNGTAFEMLNAGTPRVLGSCNTANIFLRSISGSISDINIAGNTVNVAVNAGSDANAGCAGPPPFFTTSFY